MARSKKNVKDRVLNEALRQFYRGGYYRTGIRDIAGGADVALSSVYDHFSSKEELAQQYLIAEEEQMLQNLRLLMEHFPDINDFARAWTLAKRKDLKAGRFLGCPFAGFAYQSVDLHAIHLSQLKKISTKWIETLKDYIEANQKSGRISSSADSQYVARRIMVLTQGAMTMWRITRDASYIEVLDQYWKEEMQRIAPAKTRR
ncbi:MAG: TetR/AcrR family transcriptional regulator [Leptospiraceae bacterium]